MANQKTPKVGQIWHVPDLINSKRTFATILGSYACDADTPFVDEVSVHFYRLGEGEEDKQRPHQEDELYFVLSGERVLNILDGDVEINIKVQTGDLVYVPAHADHSFKGDQEIAVLAIFAPIFSGPVKDHAKINTST